MEADFQREYQIDLELAIDNMSWRKFLILLKGLSADSILVHSLQHEQKKPIEDPAEISQAVNRVW
ncbi:MAG: hypothetical protein CVU90_02035 [Firmicutes bacterium HGW-Firmicutes-15]|nr:MAG: hypothetical protein CVU90_02035 [Firmicutes bacterium HGW-Firmicutes-15]